MGAKVRDASYGETVVYAFYCFGCRHEHLFYVNAANKPTWNFNGDINNPTFTPSLLNRWGKYVADWKPPADEAWTEEQINEHSGQCHLNITNGLIDYYEDCTHDFRGRKGVAMKEYE